MIREICTAAALLAGIAALPAAAAGTANVEPGEATTSSQGPLHDVVEGMATPQGAADPGSTDAGEHAPAGARAESGTKHGLEMTVKELKHFMIVGADGHKFGHTQEVVRVKGDLYAVVEFGTFSVLPTKPIAIPISDLVNRDGVLVARRIRRKEIEGLQKFDDSKYAKLGEAQTVSIALP